MKNIILILLGLFLLSGCGTPFPATQKLLPLTEQENCSIAILPFLNDSPYPQGGDIFYKVFTSALVKSDKFEIIQEGDILEIYRQLLIYPKQRPDRNQLIMIGGRLAPSLFIGATVQKMVERSVGDRVETELTVLLHLYDGASGQLLWTTYHRRLGSEYQKLLHIGRINSITGLALRMSQEIISDWIAQGLKPCT